MRGTHERAGQRATEKRMNETARERERKNHIPSEQLFYKNVHEKHID